ncbi:hypothetical protein F66182_9720 [Fusarium sp. NRRL 66182]|nr:hypothetical protein F66182_9720 [Fusarium sp. NRRL 66182]
MMCNPHLPLEIILHILETSFPSGRPNCINDVSTPDVQQLVAWARVCRATYGPATIFLRKHCVHLNTVPRLEAFLKCLTFPKTPHEAHPSSLPKAMPLSEASSIYIGLDLKAIQSARTSALIRDVLLSLGGSVCRLIVDLPYRRIAQEYSIDAHINMMFSRGLEALSNLEEFVTLGGLPALEFWRNDLDIRQMWPRLRCLAGFSVNLAGESLWHNVARHRTLEHLVIARPYLFRLDKWNIKRSIGGQEWDSDAGGDSTCARPLKIVIADHQFSSPIIDTQDEHIYDPFGLIDVSSFEVPVDGKRVDHICREWLINKAKQGTLWE